MKGLRRFGRHISRLLAWTLLGLAASAPAADLEPLNLGFYLPGIRDVPQADVRVTMQVWAEEVARGYNLKARAVMYEDMGALRRDANLGRIEMIIAPSMEMAETFAPEELAQGFAGLRRNAPEGLVLIAAQASGIRTLADMRGKRVARLVNDRISEVYLETLCVRETGVHCADLFSVVEEKRDIQSVHRVFFGKVDAALVRISTLHTASEMNPQVGARVRILKEWQTVALNAAFLSARASPAYRDRVAQAFMSATKQPRGRQLMELFRTDYMDRFDKQDLQPFWQLYREYQEQMRGNARKNR